MASAPWLNPTGCFPLSNWLSAFVPILDALMNRILSFPKRSRDYALVDEKSGKGWQRWKATPPAHLCGTESDLVARTASHHHLTARVDPAVLRRARASPLARRQRPASIQSLDLYTLRCRGSLQSEARDVLDGLQGAYDREL